MTVLDWVIVLCIGIGFLYGFIDGFIKQLASVVGLVIGFCFARALYEVAGNQLADVLDTSLTLARVVAFVLIWLIVPLVFLQIAGTLTRFVNCVHLGFLNRIFGAGLGVCKYVLLISAVIYLIELLDPKNELLSRNIKNTSVLYYPMENVCNVFFPAMKNVSKQLID